MTVLKGKAVNDIKYIIPIVALLLCCPLKGQSQNFCCVYLGTITFLCKDRVLPVD